MEGKQKIHGFREILDTTLASDSVSSKESIRKLVQNQLGSLPSEVQEKRVMEISDLLDMLKSASANDFRASKVDGALHGSWKDKDEYRVMYREGPPGSPFHTLLAEGYAEAPLDVCLCVGWEVSMYGKWSDLCSPKPSPLSYMKNEHICGRPLGLRFNKKTGDLYIADAYFGLMVVGPEGGLATLLVNEAEGVPFKFTNDLDIDDDDNIYFTDSSTIYQRRNFMQLIFSGDDSGRVLKYNPSTKETTVLVRNLQFPNGVALSKDKSFFIFCELSLGRLRRYWLKGEKAGTSDVFAVVPGVPDNVRTNEEGEFWVALHCRRTMFTYICGLYPKLRTFLLKLPISLKYQYALHAGLPHAAILKYSPEGKLLKILEDSQGKVVKAASEVEERDGKLWIGSVLMPFVAVYQLE